MILGIFLHGFHFRAVHEPSELLPRLREMATSPTKPWATYQTVWQAAPMSSETSGRLKSTTLDLIYAWIKLSKYLQMRNDIYLHMYFVVCTSSKYELKSE